MTLQEKNYSATHCLLLFATSAGDLLDSVKKASINCSKQTIEAFSFDIIAILINNKFFNDVDVFSYTHHAFYSYSCPDKPA